MSAYTLANKTEKALKAYERAHAWRELFALAVNEKLSEKAIADMVERVAGKLPPYKKFLAHGRLPCLAWKTSRGCAGVPRIHTGCRQRGPCRIVGRGLCRGVSHREPTFALQPTIADGRPPSLIERTWSKAPSGRVWTTRRKRSWRSSRRWRVSWIKRWRVYKRCRSFAAKIQVCYLSTCSLFKLTSDTFYIVDHDPDLEGVDVATNATTQASAFTRYTVAPTTAFSATTKMTG